MKPFQILTTLFLTILIGCNFQPENKNHKKVVKKVNCIPYFDFDYIDHYFINIEEGKLVEIEKKKNKTDKERRQLELLWQYAPLKLSDTIVLKGMEQLDFSKTEIFSEKFKQLNEIFCERMHKDYKDYACIAVYRDILVFKRKNKIIGVAKLCFGCNQHRIIGTDRNTDFFGYSGDFEKLDSILGYKSR
mgnify:CR=1 FL=1